jgi:ssDNA-binding replication factor A large subunit
MNLRTWTAVVAMLAVTTACKKDDDAGMRAGAEIGAAVDDAWAGLERRVNAVDRSLDSLDLKARNATANSKARLDATIADLRIKRAAVADDMRNGADRTGDDLRTLRDDIGRKLDAIDADIRKALDDPSPLTN